VNAHERGFPTFLAEPGKGRMMRLLEMGEKRRRKIRSLLHHAVRLDPRYRTHLTGSDDFASTVERLLRDRGAPADCYLIAADSDLDGRDMPLGEALWAISGNGNGAFISCIPGRLGYYRYEDIKSGYLLHRPESN
jgi:hypothetical protein